MADEIHIDGMLVTWGERLFYESVKVYKAPAKSVLRMPRIRALHGARPSPRAIREKLRATLKRMPEVTVKITGSGRTIKQIKNHLDYISRNGKKVLEDQDGNLLTDREAICDLRDAWRDGRHGITTDNGTVRETFNLVLSMPPGTDRQAVHDAARDFAAAEFHGNYDYVFVSHDDTRHPHAHLVVKAMGYDGKRLNPRKADLQRWRESFATKLREHGIEANATKRQARGIAGFSRQKDVIAAEREGRVLPHYHDRENLRKNTLSEKTVATHSYVLQNYRKLAEALQFSPDVEDRKLAIGIVDFVKNMSIEALLEAKKPRHERTQNRAKNVQELSKDEKSR